MKIGLIVVATGKYTSFVRPLWESALHHFFSGHDIQLLLLTDDFGYRLDGCLNLPTPHYPWPGPTLFRYRSLLAHSEIAARFDYLFQCDADMRFVGDVGEKILGELVATEHPGYLQTLPRNLNYERRLESLARVGKHEGERYHCGGFQGGSARRFLEAAERMAWAIDVDKEHGIIALWHDESHWNRYLVDNPPDRVLSPSYCYPETWTYQRLPFERKLLALDKDHSAMRGTGQTPVHV